MQTRSSLLGAQSTRRQVYLCPVTDSAHISDHCIIHAALHAARKSREKREMLDTTRWETSDKRAVKIVPHETK